MPQSAIDPSTFKAIGLRLRRLREARGLSRQAVARSLAVDVTSLAGWESGKRLPRASKRAPLAQLFATDPASLFEPSSDNEPQPIAASLVDTHADLPGLLLELTQRTRRSLRALRLAAPYPTPAHVQTEWRALVAERLRAGTLAVQRVEIIYDLRRLQEIVANIIRYDGCAYQVKSYCPGLDEVAPAFGGYLFDEDEFLLGAYWTGIPPARQPGLRVSGDPFRRFFNAYWEEIWRRGTWLNVRGAHDLSGAEAIGRRLGLRQARQWARFVSEARDLQVGDGAPPLV